MFKEKCIIKYFMSICATNKKKLNIENTIKKPKEISKK